MKNASFPHTSLTDIVQAKEGDEARSSEALGRLCANYWFPLYSYLRSRSHNNEEAEDMTQSFFQSFLTRDSFASYDPAKGKLRYYLLGALKHFEANWIRDSNTVKRGRDVRFVSFDVLEAESVYQAQPKNIETPDLLFDRGWTIALIGNVHEALREEYVERGREDLHDILATVLDVRPKPGFIDRVAMRLNMSRDAVKMALNRMRQARRRLMREAISVTVAKPDLIDEEISYLLGLFERSPSDG